MNTLTGKTQKTVSAPWNVVDLDTRLAMARIAINVACERHLTGTRQAVAEARGAAPVPQPVNEILTAAHAEILINGWHQGGYEGSHGPICALAAIDRVAVNGPARSAATRLLMDRIEGLHGARYGSIHAWNDSPGTCVDDVLDLLH